MGTCCGSDQIRKRPRNVEHEGGSLMPLEEGSSSCCEDNMSRAQRIVVVGVLAVLACDAAHHLALLKEADLIGRPPPASEASRRPNEPARCVRLSPRG